MHSAKITALHDEYSELIEFCRGNNQVSFTSLDKGTQPFVVCDG